jgi:Domain of Unknown Function (DUF1080)
VGHPFSPTILPAIEADIDSSPRKSTSEVPIMCHSKRPPAYLMLSTAVLGITGLAASAMTQAPDQAPVVAPRVGTSETIHLFDGKTLNGWAGHFKHWSVDNGEIVGKNTAPVPVSTYLLTEKNYTDFRLTAKVKLVESEMHSGIAFWGRVATEQGDPATYAGHLVMFPSGWGMYDLYGRNSLPVDSEPAKKVGKQHDWNDLEILALGNRVQVAVNGASVIDWRDPEPDRIKPGPIALQLHSNKVPHEVRFKDLVIETFPRKHELITLK